MTSPLPPNTQPELFSADAMSPDATQCFFANIQRSGYNYRELDIGDITFRPGQDEPVHRWYRLTPSYSPQLVRHFINEFNLGKSHLVLDPFSGRGTTAIECQRAQIACIALEVNPLLSEVGARSLNWKYGNEISLATEYIEHCLNIQSNMQAHTVEAVAEKLGTRVPIIHDVFRWWRPSVLKDLLIFRSAINDAKYQPIHDYIWLAVNKAALDCANIHRNHPTITFDDTSNRHIDVALEIQRNLANIHSDLSNNELPQESTAKVLCQDSIFLKPTQFGGRLVDSVITSPPYPNRFSYVHQTRPQLHFMELLSDRSAATEIDLRSIGGTWGRATSDLQKQLIPPPPELLKYLTYYDELQSKSVLMCNYATKYFVDMRAHIKTLRTVVANGFQGAYVVGNSRLSGVEIFTEVILARLFEHEGFDVSNIVSFRKRGGRKRLYETAVVVNERASQLNRIQRPEDRS